MDEKTKVEFVKPNELPAGFEKRDNHMTDMFLDELDVENLLEKDFKDLSRDYDWLIAIIKIIYKLLLKFEIL